jgi:hypothetical protein
MCLPEVFLRRVAARFFEGRPSVSVFLRYLTVTVYIGAAIGVAAWELQEWWAVLRHFLVGRTGFWYFTVSVYCMFFAVHFALCDDDRWKIVYIVAAVALELLRLALLPHALAPPDAFTAGFGAGAGIAASFVTALRLLVMRSGPKRLWLAKILFWTVLFRLAASNPLSIVLSFASTRYNVDAQVYMMDRALGFNVPAFFGVLLQDYGWLSVLVWRVYGYLPGALFAVYGLRMLYARSPGAPGADAVLKGFMIAGACALLYRIAPACGRLYPRHLPDMVSAADITSRCAGYVHNAMPSLHMTWALLLVMYAAPLPLWVRVAGWAYLALTAVATLGTGHHYLLDLVPAFPLALAVYALSGIDSLRVTRAQWVAISAGAAMTLAWLVTIRLDGAVFYDHAWFLAAAITVSIIVPLRLKLALDGRLM